MYGSEGLGTEAGNFVRRACSDLEGAAFATIVYPTDLRRFKANASLTAECIAEHIGACLSSEIIDCYRTVIVVGHCLGGLLTTMALPHLAKTRPDWIHSLRAEGNRLILFLIDAPNGLPKSPLDGIHVGLLKALRLPAAVVARNSRFWEARVLDRGPDRIPIDAYAITTSAESWVSQLNPGAGLPERNLCRVAISHQDIVRAPEVGPFEPYDFILQKLKNAGIAI